jgi:hypothetical protein
MPLGIARLNTIGRYVAAGAVSRSALTFTVTGDTWIDTAQSKFGGSSAYFDGTSDYLDTSDPSWTTTGDFTIEGWIRFETVSSPKNYQQIIDNRQGGGFSTGNFQFRLDNGKFYAQFSGASTYPLSTTTASANTWYHWAIVRSGSNLKMYINGTQEGSTATYTNTFNANSTGFRIGAYDSTTYPVQGWQDEIRISKTARYTTTFTAPTSAFTDDADTIMLLHADGLDTSTFFWDDATDTVSTRTARTFSVSGTAQLDTAYKQFGTASLLLDGNSDFIYTTNKLGLQFLAGSDFTIECWLRIPNDSGDYYIFGGDGSNGDLMVRRVANNIRLGRDDVAFDATSSNFTAANTWYHMAISRSGTSLKIFKDGTAIYSGTNNQNYPITNQFRIGYSGYGYYNGHVDEVRISDIARYTANFTAPSSEFTHDNHTVLLMHFNGSDASTTMTDDGGS